jgi:hypothetical protein
MTGLSSYLGSELEVFPAEPTEMMKTERSLGKWISMNVIVV